MICFGEKIRAQAPPLLTQCCDGLESLWLRIDESFRNTQVSFDAASLPQVSQSEYIKNVLRLLYATYLAKFRELLSEVITGANDERFLVFALAGRAFIETTAMLRYHNRKIIGVVEAAQSRDAFSPDELKQIVDVLDQHSRGGRFDWFEFWFSNRKNMATQLVARRKSKLKEEPPLPNPSQVNVMTALDRWATDEPGIALAYEFFCELVHPNLGSNFLVMGAKDGHLRVGSTTPRSVGRSLCAEGIPFLAAAGRETAGQLALLLGWWATCDARGA